ncbi:MAG TPA: hypothetical protein VIG73_13810 [Cerasibacillus sp.]|uniref:hypothetical protein n=1 Tax=Cerasibacillus sp. TaxID=2498711 RepID=UPI002F3F64DD
MNKKLLLINGLILSAIFLVIGLGVYKAENKKLHFNSSVSAMKEIEKEDDKPESLKMLERVVSDFWEPEILEVPFSVEESSPETEEVTEIEEDVEDIDEQEVEVVEETIEQEQRPTYQQSETRTWNSPHVTTPSKAQSDKETQKQTPHEEQNKSEESNKKTTEKKSQEDKESPSIDKDSNKDETEIPSDEEPNDPKEKDPEEADEPTDPVDPNE